MHCTRRACMITSLGSAIEKCMASDSDNVVNMFLICGCCELWFKTKFRDIYSNIQRFTNKNLHTWFVTWHGIKQHRPWPTQILISRPNVTIVHEWKTTVTNCMYIANVTVCVTKQLCFGLWGDASPASPMVYLRLLVMQLYIHIHLNLHWQSFSNEEIRDSYQLIALRGCWHDSLREMYDHWYFLAVGNESFCQQTGLQRSTLLG
jgi:hypothetical protein